MNQLCTNQWCRRQFAADIDLCPYCGQVVTLELGDTLLDPHQTVYTIEGVLGIGGMGAVYRAKAGGQEYALKQLLIDPALPPDERRALLEKFHEEERLLARLSHSQIPRLFGSFEDDRGRHYIVMEYIPGRTLAQEILARGSPLLPSEAIQVGIQMCEVLGYLHTRTPPIIHRDVKPGNVKEWMGAYHLLDFGIAREVIPQLRTRQYTRAFTDAYAPPEQVAGTARPNPTWDIYALGMTLYHVAANEEPGQGKPLDLSKIVNPNLRVAIEETTRLDPAQRIQSAAELREVLLKGVRPPAPQPAPGTIHLPAIPPLPSAPQLQPSAALTSTPQPHQSLSKAGPLNPITIHAGALVPPPVVLAGPLRPFPTPSAGRLVQPARESRWWRVLFFFAGIIAGVALLLLLLWLAPGLFDRILKR